MIKIYLIAVIIPSAYFLITAFLNFLAGFIFRINVLSFDKKSPKVSVLVPVRNEEKNIYECLTSLFNQDYPNYEVIVYDDLSEDNTQLILVREWSESCGLTFDRLLQGLIILDQRLHAFQAHLITPEARNPCLSCYFYTRFN